MEAWSKTFQKGWFERQRTGHTPAAPATPPPTPAPKPTPIKPPPAKVATANTRAYVLDKLGCQEEGPARENLTVFLRAVGWLDADKVVEQWPYRFVPITGEEIEALQFCLGQFSLDCNRHAALPAARVIVLIGMPFAFFWLPGVAVGVDLLYAGLALIVVHQAEKRTTMLAS